MEGQSEESASIIIVTGEPAFLGAFLPFHAVVDKRSSSCHGI